MDKPCFHMVAIPRLMDEYTAATANAFRPDNDKAVVLLKEMRDRVERALALTQGLPVERLEYRKALDAIISGTDAVPWERTDPMQVAHEAITPFTEWKAVSEDLGFDPLADRAAQDLADGRADAEALEPR